MSFKVDVLKFEKFLRIPPVAASEQTWEVSVVQCVAKRLFGNFPRVYRGCPIPC